MNTNFTTILSDIINDITNNFYINLLPSERNNMLFTILLYRKVNNDVCNKYNIDEEYSFESLANLDIVDLHQKIYFNDNYKIDVLRKLGFDDFQLSYFVENELFNFFQKIKNIENFNSFRKHYKILYELKLLDYPDKINFKLEKFLLHILAPKYNETIYNPCSNKGTTIISYLDYCLENNIEIITDNIINCDLNIKYKQYIPVFIFLLTNIPHIKIQNKNSLRNISDTKYDNIIFKPPQGITNIGFQKPLKLENEILFLHDAIHKLNNNGKCCIVLPLTFLPKYNNETLEYLTDNFNLKNIFIVNTITNKNIIKCLVINFTKEGYTDYIDFDLITINNNKIEIKPLDTISLQNLKKQNYILERSFDVFKKYEYKYHQKIKKLRDLTNYKLINSKLIDNNLISNTKSDIFNIKIKSYNKKYNNKYYKISNVCSSSIILDCEKKKFIKYNEDIYLHSNIINYEVSLKNNNTPETIVYIDYLYSYLKYNNNLLELVFNTSDCHIINSIQLYNIPVPIIPLFRQNDLVNILKYNYKIIEEYENNIKNINKSIKNINNCNQDIFNKFI